ncbi:Transcription factor 25 [Entomortierella beljakovae]|nr:Transcription factor 25 [Entomortierella beljakovae]
MSSRAMKKLLRDQDGPTSLKDLEPNTLKTSLAENEDHDDKEDDESEEDEEDFVSRRPPARNLFALLDEGDQDDDEGSEDEPVEPEIITPAATSSKKKKNKKKKSKASAAATNPFDALKENSEDTGAVETTTTSVAVDDQDASISKSKSKNKKKKGKAVVKSVEEMSVEEFEKSLQQMNKQLGSVGGAGTSQQLALTPLKQLLSVDTRFLDADAEMKKMFGARVVNSEIKDRRYVKAVKKLLLAQPRNTWQIRRASGLSMEIVESDEKEGTTTFKIVHSEFYQKTQLKFLAAVASYDPNNLVMLLRDSPFHIDSLLQLSEVSKHNGDNSLAGEFIEQALYAFEKSFHSLFNIASGTVRLSFMEVENRPFFLAIHRHIQFLGRRGCWRTAFEFNKLLLSLDPKHDELGSLFSIDFYALKAQEYTYLLKLYERLKQDHGLDRLPNFAYSTALAQFHLETQRGDNNHTESSMALQKAILMFPTAVPLLADQGSYSVDSEIAGAAAFYPVAELPKTLDLYINLFVSRNFALWKEPEVIAWLKSNLQVCVQSRFNNNKDTDLQEAKALLEEFKTNESSKSPMPSYSSDGTFESDEYSGASSSSSSLHGVTLRVCRHVLISEYTSLARYLPQHIVRSSMHMHDPLPPPGSRNVYEERFAAQSGIGGLMGGARDAAQGALQEFVRRLTGEVQGENGEIQEDQLRRIADAVQRLRIQYQGQPGQGGALPGAFPGQEMVGTEGAAHVAPVGGLAEGGGEGSAADAGVVEVPATGNDGSMLQPLADMIRQVFGRGQAAGGDAPGLQLTQEEAHAFMAALNNQGGSDSESDEDEDDEYTNEVPPFGPEGDDGWEPYDPAAFE